MKIAPPFVIPAALTLLLSACQPPVAPPAPPRAVQLESVGHHASSSLHIIATVRQQQRTELAFDSAGRIADIGVDVGDAVHAGQVLARLDAEPLRLRLTQAEANLQAARAQRDERDNQLQQQQAMFTDGAASRATLNSAQSAQQTASAQLSVAQAERDLADRAERLTQLRAPFDGRIVARLQQPAAQIALGQAVLQLEGNRRLQAQAALPAELADRLQPHDHVSATDAGGRQFDLQVQSVAPQLEHGASVVVLFSLPPRTVALRSDQSLALTLALPAATADTWSVPLSAVLPRKGSDTGQLFVYAAPQGVVRSRAVRLGALQGERIEIRSGVQAGEQVVTAGAAFLTDGEPVTPLAPSSSLRRRETP